MNRKRRADSDLTTEDSHGSSSPKDDQHVVADTWTPASSDEIADREVVKVNRKRRMAISTVSTPTPVFNFADQVKPAQKDETEPSQTTTTVGGEENPLLKFMAKSGSWNCDVCLLNNQASLTKCPACDAPKPNQTSSAPNTSDADAASKSSPAPTSTSGALPSDNTTTFSPPSTSFTFGSSSAPFKFGKNEGDQPASFAALSNGSTGTSFSFLSDSNKAAETSSSSKAFEQESPVQEVASVPTESGEENDKILLKVAVVAYNLITKEADKKQSWQECCNGDLHVNTYQDADGNTRARLVLRMAKTHRLMLNVPIFKEMALERSSDKMVRLTSVSNEDPQLFESYLLKTKSKDEADSLFNTLVMLTS